MVDRLKVCQNILGDIVAWILCMDMKTYTDLFDIY